MREKNLDIYGADSIPWARVVAQLEAGPARRYWLATESPDGHPHLAGIGARYVDQKLYFVSGPGTRKSRNLLANPHCTIAADLPDIDLVAEGMAVHVTDEATVEGIAALYAATGWPAEARGSTLVAPYSAPSAGPPPWDLWVMQPVTAFCVSTGEPQGAMRFQFVA
jgi:Pyridoxamine 5'-phosphate oxidase